VVVRRLNIPPTYARTFSQTLTAPPAPPKTPSTHPSSNLTTPHSPRNTPNNQVPGPAGGGLQLHRPLHRPLGQAAVCRHDGRAGAGGRVPRPAAAHLSRAVRGWVGVWGGGCVSMAWGGGWGVSFYCHWLFHELSRISGKCSS